MQLLHLVEKLREAKLFTIVAVTKPFAFEGTRKMDAAVSLVSQLAATSHLVAVVEQVEHLTMQKMFIFVFFIPAMGCTKYAVRNTSVQICNAMAFFGN